MAFFLGVVVTGVVVGREVRRWRARRGAISPVRISLTSVGGGGKLGWTRRGSLDLD